MGYITREEFKVQGTYFYLFFFVWGMSLAFVKERDITFIILMANWTSQLSLSSKAVYYTNMFEKII